MENREGPNTSDNLDQLTKTDNISNIEKKEQRIWRLKDIKGFIHFHSWEGSSCGKDSLERIKKAVAKKTGLKFFGMAEHIGWPGEEYWPEKIRKEFQEIDELNKQEAPRIFKGIEGNTYADGSIDIPADLLDAADIVVSSIHYKYTDKAEIQTADSTVNRWVQVMENYPEVNFLGHPLRDLSEEEWGKVDWETLCLKAKEKNVVIEVGIGKAAPDQLPKEFYDAVKKHGNLISIAPDFHSIGDYLFDSANLTEEDKKLFFEYHKLQSSISGKTFSNGEEIKSRGIFKEPYTEDEIKEKKEQLPVDRKELEILEDSQELAKIYEALNDSKNKLTYRMLIFYARRMDRIRKGLGKECFRNIINLWSVDKFSEWIKSRKTEVNLRREIVKSK